MKRAWQRRTHASPPAERGQVLILFAAGLLFFIALVGLAVDVGQVVQARTDLQKAADAAAFAAAQDLPDTGAAHATAEDYVARNTGDSTTAEITFEEGASRVRVEATRSVDYYFMQAVGISGTDVSASAAAHVGSYSGGTGLVPWGLIASNDDDSTLLQNDCYIGRESNGNINFRHNQQCVLKYGAGSNAGGDFGALGLDGPGANRYRNAIAHGSDNYFERGDRVDPETGNMVGPTAQGIETRFSRSVPDGCPGHDRNDVLVDNPDGTVSIRAGCEESPRIVIIPVVDRISNPHKSTIEGFAFMYLTGRDTSQGGQGHAEVTGEFVEFVTDLPGGDYNDTGPGASAITLVD